MKYNFAIVSGKSASIPANYVGISTNDIQDLINLSCDNILLDCLEDSSKDQSLNLIQQVLTKLKPQGILTIVISDIIKYMMSYINGSLESDALLTCFKNRNCILSLDDILNVVNADKNLKLQKIDHIDNRIAITIKRISLT